MRICSLAAIVSMACAACSNGPHPVTADAAGRDAPDPGTPDATADAPTAVTGRVTVTVHALDGTDQPQAGVHVVFGDTATVSAEVVTDATGHATANVPAGVTVTAAYPTGGGGYVLKSVLGAQPGDDVEIGLTRDDNVTPFVRPTVGSFTANVENAPDDSDYEVFAPCGSNHRFSVDPPAVKVTMIAPCDLDTMDLLAVAFTSAQQATAYVTLRDVPYHDGVTVDLPVDWQPLAPFTVDYTNIPTADVTRMSAFTATPDWAGYKAGTFVPTTAAAATVVHPMPIARTGFVYTIVELPGGGLHVYQPVGGDVRHVELDVGAARLPFIGKPEFAGLDEIRVPLPAGGRSDLASVEVYYRRGTVASGTYVDFDWQLWGPTAGDMRLPALPADLAIGPAAGETIESVKATLVDVDPATTYDQLRPRIFSTVDAFEQGRTTGRMRVASVLDLDERPLPVAP